MSKDNEKFDIAHKWAVDLIQQLRMDSDVLDREESERNLLIAALTAFKLGVYEPHDILVIRRHCRWVLPTRIPKQAVEPEGDWLEEDDEAAIFELSQMGDEGWGQWERSFWIFARYFTPAELAVFTGMITILSGRKRWWGVHYSELGRLVGLHPDTVAKVMRQLRPLGFWYEEHCDGYIRLGSKTVSKPSRFKLPEKENDRFKFNWTKIEKWILERRKQPSRGHNLDKDRNTDRDTKSGRFIGKTAAE